MVNIKSILVFLISSLFIACNDHNHHSDDVSPPQVIILSPSSEVILGTAQTINVSGSITDDIGLHQAEIKLSKGNTVLAKIEPDVFNLTSYQILENLPIAGIKVGDVLTLRVEALDHNDNIGLVEKDIIIK